MSMELQRRGERPRERCGVVGLAFNDSPATREEWGEKYLLFSGAGDAH